MSDVRHRRSQRASATAVSSEVRQVSVATEEPLEIWLSGSPWVVTMRTPGRDTDLALGLLLAEGLIQRASDVVRMQARSRDYGPCPAEVLDVTMADAGSDAAPSQVPTDRLTRGRRGTLTTASCGVCGRRTIEDLVTGLVPVSGPGPVSPEMVATCPSRLRDRQQNFDRTGGVHGALVLDRTGRVLAFAEDVGRHNAVDKVLGELLVAHRLFPSEPSAGPALLMVSGRTSFEIVQKAAVAQIPVVAAVSAPTSLAIDVADRVGITLAGFVRDGHFNVYSHADRLQP